MVGHPRWGTSKIGTPEGRKVPREGRWKDVKNNLCLFLNYSGTRTHYPLPDLLSTTALELPSPNEDGGGKVGRG